MAKIMLVEDDKNLRQIYGARLLAEGYDIVSAGDGEEALAMAIKERPQLIISDVMMPKISGFDMLDILRSTTETHDIKVIMMTALSSEEQRSRGQSLGADRYLVKSQVGIEDMIKVVHELLGDQAIGKTPQAPATTPPRGTSAPAGSGPQAPPPAARERFAAPPPTSPPATAPLTAAQAPAPAGGFSYQTPPRAIPVTPVPAPPVTPTSQTPVPAANRPKVIQPLNDPAATKVDLKELLDKELAREAGIDLDSRPEVRSAAQEKTDLENQISQFSKTPPPAPPSQPPATPPAPDHPPASPPTQPPSPQGGPGGPA